MVGKALKHLSLRPHSWLSAWLVSGFARSEYKTFKAKRVETEPSRYNSKEKENSQNLLALSLFDVKIAAVRKESNSFHIHISVQDLDVKDIGYSLYSSASPPSWQGSKASDQYSRLIALMTSGVAFLLRNALWLPSMFTFWAGHIRHRDTREFSRRVTTIWI